MFRISSCNTSDMGTPLHVSWTVAGTSIPHSCGGTAHDTVPVQVAEICLWYHIHINAVGMALSKFVAIQSVLVRGYSFQLERTSGPDVNNHYQVTT